MAKIEVNWQIDVSVEYRKRIEVPDDTTPQEFIEEVKNDPDRWLDMEEDDKWEVDYTVHDRTVLHSATVPDGDEDEEEITMTASDMALHDALAMVSMFGGTAIVLLPDEES